MNSPVEEHFATIESAHDFVSLLADAVSQAKLELERDVERGIANPTRRLDALRIALYNIDKLELHLARSSRILNDLRTLRRLLFEERQAPAPTKLIAGRNLTSIAPDTVINPGREAKQKVLVA